MEPVTHFLSGAAMGRAGLNRKTALATAALTLGAEAADLDVLSRFGGSAFGLNHHRGFTHSFLGVPLVAVVVVGFVYFLWRLRGRKTCNPSLPPRWGLLFAYACLAGLSHILLDFTTSYGVRPFWPFSERWISWDIVSIVEPVLLVVLILGLILPALFSLINEEIGARNKGPQAKPQVRLAAKRTYLGRVYLSWAEYPVTETEQVANDPVDNARAAYVVRFRDLRYGYPGRNARATLGAMVFLTRDLQVIEERFGIRSTGTKTRQQ